jgi:hypothetical protein
LDFRLYWPSNQHAVRTVTAINSVQATGVMAIKWLILERPVGYGVVPPNVPERIKEMGAAHMFASRHAPTAIASKPKHFAVATVRPVAFGRSS